MKRKQRDFQPTKLKVGRQLPKGGNVTDTSFKTKQIITPDQLSAALADKPLTALLNLLDTRNVPRKINSLHQINVYVTSHEDTLTQYFANIISKLGHLLLESDPKVTELTVEVLSSCIKLLNDVEYKVFSKSILLHLSCMMSHCNQSVKNASLIFFDALLMAHPKVVCQSPKILLNLLNMISMVDRSTVRRVTEVLNGMTSFDWRVKVLHRIQLFLRETVEWEVEVSEIEDMQEVHWDGKSPMFLPLFKNCGIGRPKVDLSCYWPEQNLDGAELKKLFFQLLPVLSGILKGELSNVLQEQKHNDIVFSPQNVKFFNSIVQILCYISEWSTQKFKLSETEGQEFSKQIQEIFALQLMKGFPYSTHHSGSSHVFNKQIDSECRQLNLGISYLFAVFILEIDEEKFIKDKEAVVNHLDYIFRCDTLCEKSFLLVLKICKLLIQSQYINIHFKNAMLVALNATLRQFRFSVLSKQLYSFFKTLTLDRDFHYLLKTDGIGMWFDSLFRMLNLMIGTNTVDVNLLRYVKQLCARKYPEFIEVLNNLENREILTLLKYENEDFQVMAMHLIFALDDVESDLLGEVGDLISAGSISLKMSMKFIRLLNARYSSKEASDLEKLRFVKFLLNTMCDTSALREKCDHTDVMGMYKPEITIKIYPTNKWQTYQKVSKLCLEYLLMYCNIPVVVEGIRRFTQDLSVHRQWPVHMVLAFLNVQNRLIQLFDEIGIVLSYSIMFSSFLYISVITSDYPEQTSLYHVPELQWLLLLCHRSDISQLLNVISGTVRRFEEMEWFYTSRVIIFLKNKGLLDYQSHPVQTFLNCLCHASQESSILGPLWHTICTG